MSGSTEYICHMPAPNVPAVDPDTGQMSVAWFNWALKIFARTGNQMGTPTAGQVAGDATVALAAANAAQATANTAQTSANTANAAVATEATTRAAADAVLQTELTPGQLPATATNDSAAVGKLGEYAQSIILAGSAVPLTTLTVANVTSLALAGGDWEVSGIVNFSGAAITTVQFVTGGISTTSATLDLAQTVVQAFFGATLYATVGFQSVSVGPFRVSVPGGGATVFLLAQSNFAASTSAAFGSLRVRRAR